jgi:protein-tyrosine phosphatase
MTGQFWYRITNLTVRPSGRPDLSVIVPGLTIGEYPTPEDAAWLRATHGITTVVNLQDHSDLASKGLELRALQSAYDEHGLRFEHVAVADGDMEMLGLRLDGLVDLIDGLLRRGDSVYLHCNAGMNRAPTVAIAYLHARRGLALDEARDFVKQRRHCVPYMILLQAHYGARKNEEQP